MSFAELMYDVDQAMGIINEIGPGFYFDMIGGAHNAAWFDHDIFDEEDFMDMYGENESDEDSSDSHMEVKTFSTLQDSSVIHRVSFRQEKNSLPKIWPGMETCYEDLYRLLEEVELMVRTWRKRCDHAYTAHLKADPQAAATEDYGSSDCEVEDDETVSSRMASFYHVPVVPNENLTRKKFCHSVKVFNKIFTTDHKFDNFQRNVHKIKKYVFVTVFQNFMGTLPPETVAKLPQELWEKIWKYTQNGYLRRNLESLESDSESYKAGQRVNKSSQSILWQVEQSRICELFGAVGNLHITLFEILFQSAPTKDQFCGSLDEWEVNNLATDNSTNYNKCWTIHYALLMQKFARLRHLDAFLAAQDSVDMKPVSSIQDRLGEVSKSDVINLYQRVERGLFSIEDNIINVKGLKEINDNDWDFYSTQMCKYFGGIGSESDPNCIEEPMLHLKLCNSLSSGQVSFMVVTGLKYSLFKLEVAKYLPRRVGKTLWRKSLCLTNNRVTVIYCDMKVTTMQLELYVWSTRLNNPTSEEQIIYLKEALVNEIVAEGEDSLDASTLLGAQPIPKKKQKGNKSASDVLDNKEGDLSKKDIKPTVFHSDQRIVVCLQNPYQKETLLNVYNAENGEKYLELPFAGEELSLVGFKDNLAMMINHTSSEIKVLNTECGEAVLNLAISDLNKTATSYGPWVGLFDCVPDNPEFLLLRLDNSAYRLYRYDPSSEMSVPVLESSGQLADKAVFTPDAMNSAKLQDGVLYFNKRSLIQLSEYRNDHSEVENYHELACYNLRQLSYAPILMMIRDMCMSNKFKYNENHLRFTDSCYPEDNFETSRPLLVVDRLKLAHVNDSFEIPKIKLFNFENDELSIIENDVRDEEKWQKNERRKREIKEEEERQLMAKLQEEKRLEYERMAPLETKMMEDREKAIMTILNKGVRVEGVCVDWRGTYGFLRSRNEGHALGRVFFHRKNVRGHEYDRFKAGCSFNYTIHYGRDPGSYQALDITMVSMENNFVRLFHGQDPKMPDPVDVEIMMQTTRIPKEFAIKELRSSNFDLPAVLLRLRPPSMY